MDEHVNDVLKKNPVASRKSGGILLHLHVQPKSATNAVAGVYDNALKIKLTAPPVEGAANRMCIKFLAKQLGLSSSAIEIISGHSGRRKQAFLHISEDDSHDYERRIQMILNKIDAWTA